MAHIFISYSRKDASYVAETLTMALDDAGLNFWIDTKLEGDAVWSREIASQIESASVVLVVMSVAAQSSQWVRREMLYAEDHGIPIFSLLLDGGMPLEIVDITPEVVHGGRPPSPAWLEQIRMRLDGTVSPRIPEEELAAREGTIRTAVERWTKELESTKRTNKLLYSAEKTEVRLDLPLDRLESGDPIRLDAIEAPSGGKGRCKNLKRKAESEWDLRNIWSLHLAWGAVSGHDDESPSRRAPILLLPVALKVGASDVYEIHVHGDWETNAAFERSFAVSFAKIEEAARTGRTGDILAAMDGWARSNSPLHVDSRHVVLENYTYRELATIRDLEMHQDQLARHDLTAAIAGHRQAQVVVKRQTAPQLGGLSEDECSLVPLICPSDSSQEAAVFSALGAVNTTIEGPPGTGKSQTISNLIAGAMATGRDVLFVAEKPAAVEAVVRSLEGDRGRSLMPLVLDTHRQRWSVRSVVTSIRGAIDLYQELQSKPPTGETQDRAAFEFLTSRHELLHGRPDAASDVERLFSTPVRSRCSTKLPTETLGEYDDQPFEVAANLVSAWSRTDSNRHLWSGISCPAPDRIPAVAAAAEAAERSANALTSSLEQLSLAGVTVPDGPLDQMRSAADELQRGFDAFSNLRSDRLGTAAEVQRLAEQLGRIDGLNRRINWRTRWHLRQLGSAPSRQVASDIVQLADVSASFDGSLGLFSGGGVTDLIAELQEALERYATDASGLAHQFRDPRPWESFNSSDIGDVASMLLFESPWAARELARAELEARIRSSGWRPVLQHLRSRDIEPSDVDDVLSHVVSYSRLCARLDTNPELVLQGGKELELFSARSRSSDAQRVSGAREQILSAWVENVQDTIERFQWQYISLQQRLTDRRLSLRDLLEGCGDVVRALKPCWIMAPIEVSERLPATANLFDLAVFDEASQITPLAAMPSILRGRSVVVAGDSKQLPPLAVGESRDVSPDEADEGAEVREGATAVESLLDLGRAFFASTRPLRWHYRSADECLISFSNHHEQLYANSLLTVPNAQPLPRLGLEVIDPFADDPQAMASAVAHQIELSLERGLSTTAGVITFNQKRAASVSGYLEERWGGTGPPGAFGGGGEGFFVRAIEDVQGDERDLIVLAFELGRGDDGSLSSNLGWLSQRDGYKRLNVAVTRARQEIAMVTNFRSGEIRTEAYQHPGASMLREYMEFVEAEVSQLRRQDVPTDRSAAIISDVAAVVRSLGHVAVEGHGTSSAAIDVAVPSACVAIDVDLRPVDDAATIRDMHSVRPAQLEKARWRHHRIDPLVWWLHRESEIERLSARLGTALSIDLRESAAPAQPADPESGRATLAAVSLRDR